LREIQKRLFMAFWMLLSPEFQQKGRHLGENSFGSMYLGVASRTKRNHQVKERSAWHPVMDGNGAFVSAGGAAHPANIAVPFKHSLPQPAEVRLILPFQRVAGRAVPVGNDLVTPAAAIESSL
jgi:hypothetical protein